MLHLSSSPGAENENIYKQSFLSLSTPDLLSERTVFVHLGGIRNEEASRRKVITDVYCKHKALNRAHNIAKSQIHTYVYGDKESTISAIFFFFHTGN